MTQLEAAREGQITAAMKTVAAEEHISEETVRERVAEGQWSSPPISDTGRSIRGASERAPHQDEREPRNFEGCMQL